ncbi:HNH endonuclease [Bythopirellula goksoeyrii]|uniref:HNH endonuclease n=1 Tax=Bythopirellula goksoeyrii TaxID=1400387 RepID=UPI0011CDC52F|nr:HNH endonuclease [Bythopirellula goksoeyrii]
MSVGRLLPRATGNRAFYVRCEWNVFLLDDANTLVDSEFSLGVLDESPCVIVESSGGANPARGVTRRNPDYNKLLGLLLQRLANADARLTAVLLDSNRVADISISDRTAKLDHPYPIDLSVEDIDEIRRMMGRAVAMMHRAPHAKTGGNAQKRIRLCLDRTVSPPQLLTARAGTELSNEITDDHAPGHTETEQAYIRKARIGQGQFRSLLLESYNTTCPILGISNPELLVASHIKPWSACTNQERLDPKNGILLSSLFDKLFDRGLITFNNDGTMIISPSLSSEDRAKCNLHQVPQLSLSNASEPYMEYHRVCVYKHT